MKPPGWAFAFSLVILLAFAANYIIRIAGPGDIRSTGIVIDFIMSHGVLTSIFTFFSALITARAFIWIYDFILGIRTPGVLRFWKLATRNPDEAYEFFLNSDVWEIRNYPLRPDTKKEFPFDKWAGPFNLYVPKIRKRICIFGKDNDYKKSQEEFIKYIESNNRRVSSEERCRLLMINNTSLLHDIAQLPQKTVSEMITFLLKNYASIHSVSDIDGFPDTIKDVSHLEEAKQEMKSLDLNPNDQYFLLAFNANLSLIGKYELIFSNNKLVQSGLQFIFYKEHFHSFFEVFYSLRNIMELDFLIDRDALEDAYKKHGASPPIPLSDLVEYYFAFYDIHPETRKDVVAFAKKIFCLSESEQQKATIDFLAEKLSSGDVMNIEDLHVRNTIQGYASLVSPANSETASLNIRIADMKWCNETYPT